MLLWPASTARRRLALLACFVVPTIALAACRGSGFDFVGSPDRKAFFKVPLDWKEFTKRDLLAASGQELSSATQEVLPWLVGFDAAPAPSADHVLELADAPDHPVVVAQALELDFSTRDQLSLGTIRNQVYPVDELLEADAAEIIDYEELVLDGGARGIRVEFDILPAGISTVTSGAEVIRVHQVGVVDAASEHLYLFTVRCEARCYDENEKLIDQIVESWTVKEH